jgi:hypothetical protein
VDTINYEKLYRKMMLEMEMRHKQNLQRIRVGLRSILIVPTIFLLLLFFTSSSKTVFLVLWIISMFAIAIYLIAVEYNDYKLQANLNSYTMQETNETKSLMEENLEQNISALHDLINRSDNSMSFLDLDGISEDDTGEDSLDSLLTLSADMEETATSISPESDTETLSGPEKNTVPHLDINKSAEDTSIESEESSLSSAAEIKNPAQDSESSSKELRNITHLRDTEEGRETQFDSEASAPSEEEKSGSNVLSLSDVDNEKADTSVGSKEEPTSPDTDTENQTSNSGSDLSVSDIEFLMNTEKEQETLLNDDGENAQKPEPPIDADILEIEQDNHTTGDVPDADTSDSTTDSGFLSLDSSIRQDTIINETGNSISFDFTGSTDTRLF